MNSKNIKAWEKLRNPSPAILNELDGGVDPTEAIICVIGHSVASTEVIIYAIC